MADWVNARGATLEKLQAQGGLWVVERVPESHDRGVPQWAAKATHGDGVLKLIAKWWTHARLGKLPRSTQQRQGKFLAAIAQNPRVVLIVRDAHLLRGSTLEKLRLLAERGATVVMEGDVACIRVATDRYASFRLRAQYVVSVTNLFE